MMLKVKHFPSSLDIETSIPLRISRHPSKMLLHTLPLLFLTSLSPHALAQTTTVTVNAFVGPVTGMSASVIAANPTATTYEVACKGAGNCGGGGVMTVIGGPSTAEVNYVTLDLTVTSRCEMTNSRPTDCTYISNTNTFSYTIAKWDDDDTRENFGAITVTGGVGKLGEGGGGETTATEGMSGMFFLLEGMAANSFEAPTGTSTGAERTANPSSTAAAQLLRPAGVSWFTCLVTSLRVLWL